MSSFTLVASGSVVSRGGSLDVRVDGNCGPTTCAGCRRGSGHISAAGCGFEPGARVRIEVPASRLTHVAALLFGVPLLALLAGAWAGAELASYLPFSADIASPLAGLALLCSGSAWVMGRGALLARHLAVQIRLVGQ